MQRPYLFFVLLGIAQIVSAQQNFKISSPKLTFENNILTVEYNLSNCSVNDIYFVALEIKDSKGNEIDARSLTGDYGGNITCGRNKQIIWNLEEDNVLLNDEIVVEVRVEKIVVSKPVSNSSMPAIKPLSRGGVILSSVIFPGLGQKLASGKSGYLSLGVISYLTAGASVYYYLHHQKKYDLFLVEWVKEESDRLFAESESSFNTSRTIMYGAIGIWTTNLIWSAVITIRDTETIAVEISPNIFGGMEIGARITF